MAVLPASELIPARARRALGLGLVLLVALVGCYLLAFHDTTVGHADLSAYLAFSRLSLEHGGLEGLATQVTNLIQPDPYVFLAAVPVIMAMLRRRWILAVALMVMVPAAIETSELLKPVLAHPRPVLDLHVPVAARRSWPSGHSTAAMVLAMAFVLASPAPWRRYVAVVGSLFTLAVIYSVLTLGWHFPSDTVGGVLVASIWSLAAVAVVSIADARFGRNLAGLNSGTHWLSHMPSLPALVVGAGLPFAIVFILRGHQVTTYASEHTALVVAAVGIAVAVVLAPAVLAFTLSGSDPAARAAHRPRWRHG